MIIDHIFRYWEGIIYPGSINFYQTLAEWKMNLQK